MCKKKESWHSFLSFFLLCIIATFALGKQNKTDLQWCSEKKICFTLFIVMFKKQFFKDKYCSETARMVRQQMAQINKSRMRRQGGRGVVNQPFYTRFL